MDRSMMMQRVLRRYMLDLQDHKPASAPVFAYDPTSRCWYLNFYDHSVTGAVVYWEKWGLNEANYRERLR